MTVFHRYCLPKFSWVINQSHTHSLLTSLGWKQAQRQQAMCPVIVQGNCKIVDWNPGAQCPLTEPLTSGCSAITSYHTDGSEKALSRYRLHTSFHYQISASQAKIELKSRLQTSLPTAVIQLPPYPQPMACYPPKYKWSADGFLKKFWTNAKKSMDSCHKPQQDWA